MIAITPVVKYGGNHTVVHVIADSTELLIAIDELVGGNGIRNKGTCNEHLSVTVAQANLIASVYDTIQLEQSLMYYKEAEV